MINFITSVKYTIVCIGSQQVTLIFGFETVLKPVVSLNKYHDFISVQENSLKKRLFIDCKHSPNSSKMNNNNFFDSQGLWEDKIGQARRQGSCRVDSAELS